MLKIVEVFGNHGAETLTSPKSFSVYSHRILQQVPKNMSSMKPRSNLIKPPRPPWNPPNPMFKEVHQWYVLITNPIIWRCRIISNNGLYSDLWKSYWDKNCILNHLTRAISPILRETLGSNFSTYLPSSGSKYQPFTETDSRHFLGLPSYIDL